MQEDSCFEWIRLYGANYRITYVFPFMALRVTQLTSDDCNKGKMKM